MGAISCKWSPDHIWEGNQSQLTAAINRRIPSGIHLARQSVRDGSIIKFRNWERSIGSFRRSINVPNLYWALKNFYEIGDCHRPLQDTMDWDCKERKQNTYWTQQKGSPMHLIMIVCKMKAFLCRCVSLGLNERFQSVDSYPMSKCGTGCSVHFIVTGNLRAAWIHSVSISLVLINNNKRIDVFPFARTLQTYGFSRIHEGLKFATP